MFSKSNKKSSGPSEPALPPAPPSIVSRDLSIVGDLLSDGEIQIDGAVNGDIRTKTLIVGETAKVKGEIVADNVKILGSVDGQIRAKVVKLAASSHVVGDILHEDLAIETGAFLEGHCKRMAMPEDLQKSEKAAAGKGEGAVQAVNKPPAPKPVKPVTT